MPAFPEYRARRLRRTEALRRMVRETTVLPADLILPLFVRPGKNERQPVSSMPGVFQISIDELIKEATEAQRLGIGGILLFGLPESKDERGSGGYDTHGIVQNAVRAVKDAAPDLPIITDVCLCE